MYLNIFNLIKEYLFMGIDWIDVDYDYDVTYKCEQCKKITEEPNILKCVYCKRKLCRKCLKLDFCQEHFNMIPSHNNKKLK